MSLVLFVVANKAQQYFSHSFFHKDLKNVLWDKKLLTEPYACYLLRNVLAFEDF